MTAAHNRRVLLKLSGEALGGASRVGLDADAISDVSRQIVEASTSIEIAIVVGAGNICRGANWTNSSIHRSDADAIGMAATHVNALSLALSIEAAGATAAVFGAGSPVPQVKHFDSRECRQRLASGQVIVLSGGTGNPFFTTDTCAALRAAELDCQELLKGTKHDGIYDRDPAVHEDAVRLPETTFDHVLEQGLEAMDSAAFSLCRDQKISLRIFDMTRDNAILEALTGVAVGSIIRN